EPSDWVVRCEWANGDVTLPPDARFMGLELEQCLDVFDHRAQSVTEIRRALQQKPRVLQTAASFVEEELISAPWHSFFRLHRLRGKHLSKPPSAPKSLNGRSADLRSCTFQKLRSRRADSESGAPIDGRGHPRWPGKELMLLIALKGGGELISADKTQVV